MGGVPPVVRYVIVCKDVVVDSVNPQRITIVELISSIKSLDYPPFPLTRRELCVFVQLTECRGAGGVRVEIVLADTGQPVARTKTRSITFSGYPLEILGFVFRIQDCTFPDAGLYLVQFWYNDSMIAEHPLLLR